MSEGVTTIIYGCSYAVEETGVEYILLQFKQMGDTVTLGLDKNINCKHVNQVRTIYFKKTEASQVRRYNVNIIVFIKRK